MSEIRFHRALLWLPMLVPILSSPVWLRRGVDTAPTLIWLVTVGIGYVGVPYAVLALWTNRWLRTTPALTTRAIWQRALLLPAQLIPLYVAWEVAKAIVSDRAVWEGLVGGVGLGLTWVLWIGYAYVGFACALTRLCRWAGCVRTPTHASAT